MTGGITIGVCFKQKIMLCCFMKAENINTGGPVRALTLHRHQQTGALRACQTIISLSRLRAISAVKAHSYQRRVPLLVQWNQRGLMSRCRTNTVLSWQVAPNYINKPDYSGTLTVYTRFKRIIWVHGQEKDERSACVFESKVRNDFGAQRCEQR